ncbi:unnamed protein product [Didymodactylos carnosus]|uniref:Uncharacterized protein n=1 Tax=Didymodactylos carnosus TaxID=1234261 RepID=A0A8S2RE03_9BILA|nr:unnamed protein product [Didymodactylos carnosus]CAF4154617.1 unnamed protein product [Didymodactylos carnosus]
MEKSNKHSCRLREKPVRDKERIRSLENYQTVYDFATANKLIPVYSHNACYMELHHNNKRNATIETTQNQDGQTIMNIDLQCNVGTQTDQINWNYTSVEPSVCLELTKNLPVLNLFDGAVASDTEEWYDAFRQDGVRLELTYDKLLPEIQAMYAKPEKTKTDNKLASLS